MNETSKAATLIAGGGRLAVGIFLAVAVAAVLLPILVTLQLAFWSSSLGRGGFFTLSNFLFLFTNKSMLPLLWTTAVFTVSVAAGGTALGGFMAWVTTSTNVPMPRFAYLIPLIPLLLPPFMKDFAWIILYRPNTGLVNVGLRGFFGLENSPFNIHSLTGMTLVAIFGMAPIAYVVLASPLSSLNHTLVEASRVAGASAWLTLRRVTIPVLTPAVLSAAALLGIMIASAFETPVLIGQPGGVRTYISVIFAALNSTAVPDYNLAAAECTAYLVFTLAVLWLYLHLTRVERKYAVVSGQSITARVRFGTWGRWSLFAFLLVYLLFAAIQLVAATLFVSFVSFFSVTKNTLVFIFSTVNYTDAMQSGQVGRAIWNSLWVGLIVSTLVVVAATLLSFVSIRARFRGRRVLEAIATFPIAVPPLVFSVAILLSLLSLPGARAFYNTVTPLLIADAVVFLPFATRVLVGAIIQVHTSMEEASRIAGASAGRTFRLILVPLLTPALIGSFALVFAFSFRELGAIALLVPPGTPLLPTEIFQFWEIGQYGPVAVLNILSVFVLAVALLIVYGPVNRFSRGARPVRMHG
ncbi:MAG: iron ABC transporter permease [Bauldia sp.]